MERSSSGRRKVLVLSPLKKGSGNRTTALRIHHYFEGEGGLVFDPSKVTSPYQLQDIVTEEGVDVVLALQAFHCAPALQGYGGPYVLIFGGTDVNCDPKNTDKLAKMTAVVVGARCLVGFTSEIIRKAKGLWPHIPEECYHLIPQGISVSPSSFCLCDLLPRSEAVHRKLEYLALVASIRPVKDPLFLVKHFSEWYCNNNSGVILVIIGPVMDKDYSINFFDTIHGLPGIHYVENLSLEDTHAAVQGSLALVNSSVSEGMSAAILEAMALNVPVIARDIPGNRGLITDGETGLLYETPQEFTSKVEKLWDDASLRERLVRNAGDQISQHHSCIMEAESYHELIHDLVTN